MNSTPERVEQDAWGSSAIQFYDRQADWKSAKSFHRAFVRSYSRLHARLPLSSTSKILDLGCGTGELEVALKNRNVHIIGMDLSFRSLAVARAYGVGDFIRGDMVHLPFPDQSLDGVCALSSLEFLYHKKEVFNEIQRVLKPEGFVYIEVRIRDFLLYRLPAPVLAFFEKLKLVKPYPVEKFRDLTCKEWRDLFRETHFHLERTLPSLRPSNYGTILTRLKNGVIGLIRLFCPLRFHYMAAFFLRKVENRDSLNS